jgi:hypothetical protein
MGRVDEDCKAHNDGKQMMIPDMASSEKQKWGQNNQEDGGSSAVEDYT